ncbi:MAG TPA: mannonate dehydratase [Lentisphaeria bacterium]|nr:TIM barrel protein [Lentisphaerota bacterium]OQC16785.1 MAG: Mannonate dehydratase [Lentisphaerae bacterium ADurb.Bin082]HPY90916.1 mannonate dehydratase [Lentisphaeria bacterium]HQC51875.1 mannonate dehydratase [Lentisphaeria bacterium]HQL86403.1 mannonate dehydratase [Lentisphaeria bacterium]
MKLGLMLPVQPNLQWTLASQLGMKYAVTKAAPELSGLADPSDFNALKTVRDRFSEAGFELYALEGDEFDMTRIKMGLPGRDEDLEKYRKMLLNMGRLGLKLLCYNFMVGIGWYRSRNDLKERGGALTSGFDIREIDNDVELKISEEQVWKNYEYFLRAVLPAAEEAGVKLGLHPDDPPVSPLLGYSRVLTSADAYRKVMNLSSSPSHGITFCQATFRAMGEDVFKLITEFRKRIFFLHFRDVTGTRECFRETFHDNGPTDMAELLRLTRQYAPDCLIRPDHTPTMAGESNEKFGYTMQGNLFAIGYIRGILDALDNEGN